MVWVYNRPLNRKEEEAYKVLLKILGNRQEAFYRTKLFSLAGYILSHNPKSSKEIETMAYFDKEKTCQIFNPKSAKLIFHSLRQKGSGKSSYPFANHVIFKFKDTILGFLPDFVGTAVNGIGTVATFPITMIKKLPVVGNFADLGLDVLHGVVEVGVTTAEDVAKGVAGPVGAVGSVPFAAIPTAVGSILAIGQGDPAQAFNHAIKLIPVVGTSLNKGMTQLEHQVEKLKDHPQIASMIPVVGDYVASSGEGEGEAAPAPATAGKRLSTRKRSHNKWNRTMRQKK